MYQILMISSLYIIFKLCDWIIDEYTQWKVKRNILSNPIQRYEYFRGSYTAGRMKKLKRMPYHEYLKTHHWDLARSAVLNRDQNRCVDCGGTVDEMPLEVHHITYIRRGKEKMEDLMTLCRECHQERHYVSTIFE